MKKIRLGAGLISLVGMLVFATAAHATGFTQSAVTSPADGSLFLWNVGTNPSSPAFTVSGTTNGTIGELFDIDCYNGNVAQRVYAGPSNSGIALTQADGSFSVSNVPESSFAGRRNAGTCHLVVVPDGTTPALGNSYTGPRVGFSEFSPLTFSGGTYSGQSYDYYFDDATPTGAAQSNSIDNCGPYGFVTDGTSAMNPSPMVFYCAGSFYNSPLDFTGPTEDLTRAEIEVDGQAAYGSISALQLFDNFGQAPGFPALSVTLDSFNAVNGDAQTTESEPLVKCTPTDVYNPNSSDCTAFAPTGVAIKRVTTYTSGAQVATVTDTFSSTDGAAHSIDLLYEDNLAESTAGWEFPGQSSFVPLISGSGPSASSASATIYVIDDTGAPPGLSNPVGALTYSVPYKSVSFDDTLYPGEPTALFDYQESVPANGSVSIAWSYATGTSLAELQADAAATPDLFQPPAVTISSPTAGTNLLSQPVKVSGAASAGSGVKSVTVNGVTATVTGGSWTASVPLTKGTDTLTATVTSSLGNTASASEKVTYAPPAALIRRGERFNGRAVLVKVACAATGSDCPVTIRLTYFEDVVKHHRRRRIMVGSVTKHQTVLAGDTVTVTMPLRARQRRALKRAGRLKVSGVVLVAQVGGIQAATSHGGFTFTIKQPVKKRR